MPLPTETLDTPKIAYYYNWSNEHKQSTIVATGGLTHERNIGQNLSGHFFHSSLLREINDTDKISNLKKQKNTIDKKLIKYEKIFDVQYAEMQQYFGDVPHEAVRALMNASLSYLLELEPNVLSLELTSDQTIFYTFKKGDLTIYINHFADLEEDDAELTLTIFEGNQKQPSFAGTLETVKSYLNNLFVDEIAAC